MRGELTIHQHRLRHIIRVMTRNDMSDAQPLCAAIQRLSSKDATIGTIALLADLLDHLIHRPAVQVIIADDLQRQAVLDRVPLHRLQTVVPIALDALVNAEQHQFESVIVPLVQRLHHRGQHRAVFAPRRADRDPFPSVEERVRHDDLVDFRLEDDQEAGLAKLLLVLRSHYQGACCLAVLTWCHGLQVVVVVLSRVPHFSRCS